MCKNTSPCSTSKSRLFSFITGLLFCLGIATVYMSDLRLPNMPIGIGGVSLLLWIVLILSKNLFTFQPEIFYCTFLLILFWCLTFVFLALGFIYALYLERVSTIAFHNAISYLFVAIFSIALISYSADWMRLENLVIASTITFLCGILVIYLWSFLSHDFFGIPLFSSWKYSKFEGLASNPNQTALYALASSYICLAWYRRGGGLRRTSAILALVLCVSVGLHTQSDALQLSWFVGVFIYLLVYLRYKLRNRTEMHLSNFKLIVSIYSGLFFLLATVVFLREQLFEYLNVLAVGDVWQGIPRNNLMVNGMSAISESPVVGLGPGAFSGLVHPFENNEVHITVLDWATQTGILGSLLLILLVGYAMFNAWRNHRIDCFVGMASLVVFSQFHYILRQPIFWVFIVLSLFSEKGLFVRQSTNSPQTTTINSFSNA